MRIQSTRSVEACENASVEVIEPRIPAMEPPAGSSSDALGTLVIVFLVPIMVSAILSAIYLVTRAHCLPIGIMQSRNTRQCILTDNQVRHHLYSKSVKRVSHVCHLNLLSCFGCLTCPDLARDLSSDQAMGWHLWRNFRMTHLHNPMPIQASHPNL